MKANLTALALACALAGPTLAAPAYSLVQSVPLGAPDRWDYVVFDAGSHRVYVAHGDRVSVVDGRDGKMIGEVVGIPGGTHGIGISAETGEGYTDDGKAGSAIAFDLTSLKVKATIPVLPDADAIAFDRASGHIFVVEGDPAKVAVIDPKTHKVLANVDVGGKAEYAVSDDRGSLYVNGEEKREIVRIDTRTNAVTAHWAISDCASPHGLAIDTRTHRLFSSCVNSVLVVVDADTGREVASAPIGRGTDAAAFDAKRNLIFSSNGVDGTLSVIAEKSAETFAPTATVTTAVTGRTMAVDPSTGRLYIAAADSDPSPTPGGRPRPRSGSLKLLFFDPKP